MGQQFHVRQSGDELYQMHRAGWELVPSSRQSRSSHANQASTGTILNLCKYLPSRLLPGVRSSLLHHTWSYMCTTARHSNIKPSVFTAEGQYCAKPIKGWDMKYWTPFSLPFFLQDRESVYVARWSQTCPSPASSPTAPSSFASTSGDSHWKEKATLWQDLNEN